MLDHETVSVGVVAPGAYFASQKESKADYLRREPEAPPHLPKVEEFPDYLFLIVNNRFKFRV